VRVVIAPDSFKGTMSAAEAASALASGWRGERPGDEILTRPMADGGEGTLDAFEAAGHEARRMPVQVRGPLDRVHDAHWLLLADGTGVVELAATSGLTLLERPRALDSHTFGFGQAIADALEHGVRRLLLAIGGSASTDGGVGMLTALGARFLDEHGVPVPPGGAGLDRIARVDLSDLPGLPPAGADVLSDVTNPLCGPRGAAAVYGEQKGADKAMRARLDAGLAHLAALTGGTRAQDEGAGAAGGTGFGLLVWGDHSAGREPRPGSGLAARDAGRLRMVSGARAVSDAIGLPEAVASADVTITGEGRYDGQSSSGKVPWLVSGLPTRGRRCLVAGSIIASVDRFDAAVSLAELAGGSAQAQAEPGRWLQRAGHALARAQRN
jgi:glycerate kinase